MALNVDLDSIPQIPVGLGTKLGVVFASLASIAALVSAIIEGDHSEETIGAAVIAAASLWATISSRGGQAAEIYRGVAQGAALEHARVVPIDESRAKPRR